MSFGIGMRAAGIFPDWFIAFFYTGLGLALTLAGVSYIARGVRGRAWAFHGTAEPDALSQPRPRQSTRHPAVVWVICPLVPRDYRQWRYKSGGDAG